MDTLQKGTTVEQLKMAYDEAKAYAVEVTYTELAKKVDKVTGKGLSTNDYTTDEKNKLSGIASGATKVTTDTVAGWGYTKNTGTVTSVAVKMNGSVKGTVTTNGTIDLGTVITSHQDISGKADKATTLSGYGITNAYTKTEIDNMIGNIETLLAAI